MEIIGIWKSKTPSIKLSRSWPRCNFGKISASKASSTADHRRKKPNFADPRGRQIQLLSSNRGKANTDLFPQKIPESETRLRNWSDERTSHQFGIGSSRGNPRLANEYSASEKNRELETPLVHPRRKRNRNLPAKSRKIDGGTKTSRIKFKPGDDYRGRRAWWRTRVRVWEILVQREERESV